MRKRLVVFLAALLLPALLTGCRTRMIENPELADSVMQPTGQDLLEESGEPSESVPPEEFETPPETETALAESAESEPDGGNGTPVSTGTVDAVSQSGVQLLQEQTAADVTVTYDSNGGDTETVSTVVRPGECYGAQPTATRRGYAFAGWWTAKTGGVQVLPETIVTQTGSHSLYAHWQDKRTCTVTFDGGGGRVKSKEAVLELSDGDAFGTLPTPLREGYSFDGWFTAPEGGEQITQDSVFHGVNDLTLYAHWTYNPYEFWLFTLKNKTQQIYMCQQAAVYVELEQNNVTQINCPLVTITGSLNIAENLQDAAVTDDWVQAKKPQVVVKCVGSMANAAAVRQAMSARFPEQKVAVVSSAALGGDSAAALYVELALAKSLYPDWYTDVELSTVAAELGVSENLIYF